jgi:hypothetical protein
LIACLKAAAEVTIAWTQILRRVILQESRIAQVS